MNTSENVVKENDPDMIFKDVIDEIKNKVYILTEMEERGSKTKQYGVVETDNKNITVAEPSCLFCSDGTIRINNFLTNNETYECSECGANGSVIDFIMRHENMNLDEALDYFRENYDLKN